MESIDRVGRTVRVGSKIRILGFAQVLLDSLLPDDRLYILEMIGEVFEVNEIDEAGLAWVNKQWKVGDGDIESHEIGLAPFEMELVSSK